LRGEVIRRKTDHHRRGRTGWGGFSRLTRASQGKIILKKMAWEEGRRECNHPLRKKKRRKERREGHRARERKTTWSEEAVFIGKGRGKPKKRALWRINLRESTDPNEK